MSQPQQSASSASVPPAPTLPATTPAAPTNNNQNVKTKKSASQRFYIVLYILLRPVTLPFAIGHYMARETKNITFVILNELKKVGKLGYNFIELGLLLITAVKIILFQDGNTKPLMPRMMEVFNKMANTLTDFQVLPCSKESGALAHLMLNRLPKSMWETLLPYPHPFFRGSITQAVKSDTNSLITSTEAVPEDQYSPFIKKSPQST